MFLTKVRVSKFCITAILLNLSFEDATAEASDISSFIIVNIKTQL